MNKKKSFAIIFLLILFISLISVLNVSASVQDEIIDCYNDQNCDDSPYNYSYNQCINPGTISSQCVYEEIKCLSDSDCGKNGFLSEKFCFIYDVFKNYQ